MGERRRAPLTHALHTLPIAHTHLFVKFLVLHLIILWWSLFSYSNQIQRKWNYCESKDDDDQHPHHPSGCHHLHPRHLPRQHPRHPSECPR